MTPEQIKKTMDELTPAQRAAFVGAVEEQAGETWEKVCARYAEQAPLASAGGADLDMWGRLLGVERGGADDEAYRRALGAAGRPAGVRA